VVKGLSLLVAPVQAGINISPNSLSGDVGGQSLNAHPTTL
jgi:hypothetical protein